VDAEFLWNVDVRVDVVESVGGSEGIYDAECIRDDVFGVSMVVVRAPVKISSVRMAVEVAAVSWGSCILLLLSLPL
jgi:hypothetical protein